jgi:23S rRNA (adenine2503-C2)-methyltransferase
MTPDGVSVCLRTGELFCILTLMAPGKTNLLGMTKEALSDFVAGMDEPRYRGGQLFTWLYGKGAGSVDAMSDIGKRFRARLGEVAVIAGVTPLQQQFSQRDATTKFLFALSDGARIESVLIPPASAFRGGSEDAGGDDEQKRLTLCVSTQVGCPLDCAFCATGTMGFTRNLSAGEIVDQLLQVKRATGRRITNIVFMGMGEPLLNYDAVMTAADIIAAGAGVATKRMTVSTAGRADRIRRMGTEGRRVKLALSLHSAVDETRSRLMPINRRFGLEELASALEEYYRHTKQRVTHEVIFFDGVNDSDTDVRRLISFARRVPSKINVIPYHSIAFTGVGGFAASLRNSPRMEQHVDTLRAAQLTVMVRSSAGEDITAACGQLAVAAKSGASRRATAFPVTGS